MKEVNHETLTRISVLSFTSFGLLFFFLLFCYLFWYDVIQCILSYLSTSLENFLRPEYSFSCVVVLLPSLHILEGYTIVSFSFSNNMQILFGFLSKKSLLFISASIRMLRYLLLVVRYLLYIWLFKITFLPTVNRSSIS